METTYQATKYRAVTLDSASMTLYCMTTARPLSHEILKPAKTDSKDSTYHQISPSIQTSDNDDLKHTGRNVVEADSFVLVLTFGADLSSRTNVALGCLDLHAGEAVRPFELNIAFL